MKESLIAAVCVLGLQGASMAGDTLTWKYDGYARLPKAAQEAKLQGKRLLVGLSGSST